MKRSVWSIVLAMVLVIAVFVPTAYAAGPSVTIKSPVNRSTVSGTVLVSATVTGTGITSVVYKIDSTSGTPTTMIYNSTSKLYEANWNTAAVSNASHKVYVQATNAGGTTSKYVTVTVSNGGSGAEYKVIGYNDLGMHCACPRPDIMMLLPPYNTLRVQLIQRGSPPIVTNDSTKFTVEYKVRENTYGDNGPYDLDTDPQYLAWLDTASYNFTGANISRTNPVGLTGKGLSGVMDPEILTSSPGQAKFWEAAGVPAFPPSSTTGEFIDAFGTKRKAYLHWDVTVKNKSTGSTLATTSTSLPIAFGGCCNCHQQVAINKGYIKGGACGTCPDPYDVFQSMMKEHFIDTGVDPLTLVGPHYDAQGHLTSTDHPVRCSKCHVDAAVGGASALDSTWVTYAKSKGYASIPTFSRVLHEFHTNSAEVQTTYNANIETDCYSCHPGGNGSLDCYRGHHVDKLIGSGKTAHKIWCTDCHGNLFQRIATGELNNPWNYATLPACGKSGCHNSTPNIEQLVGTPSLFGRFLGSSGHKGGKIMCSTCHGQPHAEQLSAKAIDNEQNIALQGSGVTLGKCDVCHIGKSSQIGTPNHNP